MSSNICKSHSAWYMLYTPCIIVVACTLQVTCNKTRRVKEVTEVSSAPNATHLNWGEVLVSMQYAPINPADAYTIATGGMYGDDQVQPPFLCGHDGVGTVTKVCHVAARYAFVQVPGML